MRIPEQVLREMKVNLVIGCFTNNEEWDSSSSVHFNTISSLLGTYEYLIVFWDLSDLISL